MLPQPFATTAMMKDSSIRIALDVNSIWEDLTGVGMITGVTVARRGFAEENPEAVASFLAEYAESVAFCNASPDAPRSIASYSIVPEPVAQLAIPYCNIVMIPGDEMEEMLSFYLDVLYEANDQAVGGKVPLEDFYWVE